MATRRITIDVDEELFDTTSLLAEASAETTLNVYVIDAISYVNRMRMGLPETKGKISQWWERKHATVERVAERCEEQLAYEQRRRVGAG
jgi:hypothetical protein